MMPRNLLGMYGIPNYVYEKDANGEIKKDNKGRPIKKRSKDGKIIYVLDNKGAVTYKSFEESDMYQPRMTYQSRTTDKFCEKFRANGGKEAEYDKSLRWLQRYCSRCWAKSRYEAQVRSLEQGDQINNLLEPSTTSK